MAKKKLTDYFLYRRRFLLTGIFIFAVLAALLYASVIIPGGLTGAERASAAQSATYAGFVGVNSPYYLLQRTSIELFGFTTTAIKLPSVLLAAVFGVAIFTLFRRWLSSATAMFGSLLVFSGTTFLSLAGTGTPAILYLVYPTILLFFGTRVTAHDRVSAVCAILMVGALAAALLTPGLVYLVVLAVLIGLFNPHVRYGFRRLRTGGLLALSLGFLLSLVPVAYLIFKDHSAVRSLLAVPNSASVGSILATIGQSYDLFMRFLSPGLSAGMIAPVVGVGSIGLVALGLYRIAKGAYSARSQFLLGWCLIALVLVIMEPGYAVYAYLPLVIVAVFGLGQLIAIWYRTFPLNPYARFSAMIPIGVLIAGVVIGSSLRYVNTTRYASGAADLYSHDLQLLEAYLPHSGLKNATLAVDESDVVFYSQLHSPALSHVIAVTSLGSSNGPLISIEQTGTKPSPSRILSDARARHADRFYIYR